MLGAEMSEHQPMESKPAAPPRSPGGRRRGRRGGRGRRRPAPAAQVAGSTAPVESPAERIEPPIRVQEMPVRPAPSKHKIQPPVPAAAPATVSAPVPAAAPVARAPKPDGSAINRTVEEVRQIVDSLEQALEQMGEVLRLVELAEHQKFADERELESLRRALHKLQPPHRERREHGG